MNTKAAAAAAILLALAVTPPAAADPDMGETVNEPPIACLFEGGKDAGFPAAYCPEMNPILHNVNSQGKRTGYLLKYSKVWVCEETFPGTNLYRCKVKATLPIVRADSVAPGQLVMQWEPANCVIDQTCVVAGYVAEVGGVALGDGTYEVIRTSPVLSPQTYSHTFNNLTGGRSYTSHVTFYYGSLETSGHVFCSWQGVTVSS